MSTLYDIGSWIFVWTMVLSNIFKYCRGGGGQSSHQSLRKKYLVMTMPIECKFDALFNRLQLKIIRPVIRPRGWRSSVEKEPHGLVVSISLPQLKITRKSLLLIIRQPTNLFLLLAIKYFLNMG